MNRVLVTTTYYGSGASVHTTVITYLTSNDAEKAVEIINKRSTQHAYTQIALLLP